MQQVKNDNVKFFEENKYVKLPQVLHSQVNQLLYEYVKTSAYKCKLIQDWSYFSTHPNYYNIDDHGYFDDPLTPGDFAKYGDMFFDTLLLGSLGIVENATGLNLIPAFSYYRLYTKGSVLEPHKDRASSEISITLCVGYTDDQWPIFMDGIPVYQEPGDMVVYRGSDVLHGREELKGENQAQVFLHYTTKEIRRYDGRSYIGLPSIGVQL